MQQLNSFLLSKKTSQPVSQQSFANTYWFQVMSYRTHQLQIPPKNLKEVLTIFYNIKQTTPETLVLSL